MRQACVIVEVVSCCFHVLDAHIALPDFCQWPPRLTAAVPSAPVTLRRPARALALLSILLTEALGQHIEWYYGVNAHTKDAEI
jgi:hypothetical protein